MSVQWITYKGKKILYSDWRGLSGAQLVANEELLSQTLQKEPGKVLVLDNFFGVMAGRDFIAVLVKWAPRLAPYVDREAVVINGGLADALLNLYNMTTGREVRPFPDEEQAKKWLVS
jgi:hypothetical protein